MKNECIPVQEQESTKPAPIDKLIEELETRSRYVHETLDDKQERITSPEEKFLISNIADANDPRLEKLYDLLVGEFGEGETESLEWMRHAIEEDINHYHVVQNETDNIVSVAITQYLTTPSSIGARGEDALIYISYIFTKPELRGKQLAAELYRSFYKSYADRAIKNEDRITAVIGETETRVETFLNRMGRQRVYFEDASGNVCEVPYTFPSVEIDLKTGEPIFPPTPEHFMIRMLDGRREIPARELLPMMRRIMIEYVGVEGDYASPQAYQVAMAYIDNLFSNIEQALSGAKNGMAFLMSKTERETKRQKLEIEGKQLIEIIKDDDA